MPLNQISPSLEESKAFIHRYFQALSGKEKPATTVDEYVANEPLKQYILDFEAAFPRYRLIVEEMIAQGDLVAVRLTGEGTHEGEFAGIAPTGREVSFPVIAFYRIADGKIVDFWIQADVMSLIQQLTTEDGEGQTGGGG